MTKSIKDLNIPVVFLASCRALSLQPAEQRTFSIAKYVRV